MVKCPIDYKNYLSKEIVSVIKSKSLYRSELNSRVYSIPAVKTQDFIGNSSEFTVNCIVVTGELNEPLHFHKTNIIALVTYGNGRILYSEKDNNNRMSINIEIGDIVVIPSGALHAFESNKDQTAVYSVLEFGCQIDYQRHYYY